MLLAKLSENDKSMMKSWVDDYAGGPSNRGERASIDSLLRYWNKSKERLFKLLGEQFIVSKSVSFEKRKEDMQDEIYHAMQDSSSEMFAFARAFRNWCWDTPGFDSYCVDKLLDCEILADNEYYGCTVEIPLKDGKKLKVQGGTKPLRALGKIAAAYDLPGFEEFRLAHSRILNQKKLSGELCLSIHPMDYMTMSDNECDWDSCMSWRNEGCYRRGTVEMMNSDCVVVAYLKAKDDMPYRDWYWSNKKWRMLIIVDEQCIAGVKGYPYQHNELTQKCLDWLAELATENCGWEFCSKNHAYDYSDRVEDEETGLKHRMNFTTEYMYNDFDTCTHWIKFGKKAKEYIDIEYSGVANCMFCGDIHSFEDEDEACSLVCEVCWDTAYCDICDERYERATMYVVDGEYICEHCYEYRTTECPLTEELHQERNMTRLYLARGEEVDFDTDKYIEVYMPDVREKEWIAEKYFPRAVRNSSGYGIFRHAVRRWEDVYWVTTEECSGEGLKLFGLENRKALVEYKRGGEANSLLAAF
jgi:hypothetical protein